MATPDRPTTFGRRMGFGRATGFGCRTGPGLRTGRLAVTLAVAVALATVGCGGVPNPVDAIQDAAGVIAPEELRATCEELAEHDVPDGMPPEAFEELLAGYRFLCAQLGYELPPASGAGGGDGFAGEPGAAGGGQPPTDADAREPGDDDGEAQGLDDAGDAADDETDEATRRRAAIEAGPQCDPAEVDLSMSEIAKAPTIDPRGSPPFDGTLATQQYRNVADCLPEPYRSEWHLVTDAYEPIFHYLEAYAAASGSERLINLGPPDLGAVERLSSPQVQDAIASTQAFFAEVAATGAWDGYADPEVATPWWEGDWIPRVPGFS